MLARCPTHRVAMEAHFSTFGAVLYRCRECERRAATHRCRVCERPIIGVEVCSGCRELVPGQRPATTPCHRCGEAIPYLGKGRARRTCDRCEASAPRPVRFEGESERVYRNRLNRWREMRRPPEERAKRREQVVAWRRANPDRVKVYKARDKVREAARPGPPAPIAPRRRGKYAKRPVLVCVGCQAPFRYAGMGRPRKICDPCRYGEAA